MQYFIKKKKTNVFIRVFKTIVHGHTFLLTLEKIQMNIKRNFYLKFFRDCRLKMYLNKCEPYHNLGFTLLVTFLLYNYIYHDGYHMFHVLILNTSFC